MNTQMKIPLLKDHHSHPSAYTALNRGLDLWQLPKKEDALKRIEQLDRDFNLVLGWNNSLYDFSLSELDHLAPLLICNVSFHGFLMNGPAKQLFNDSFPEIVHNIDDKNWIENNLPKISQFIANANRITKDEIKDFYASILKQGVYYAEEMLLPNDKIITQYKETDLFDRTCFWADLDTFATLDEDTQNNVYGIKIFLDGALGSKTAAISLPFLTGEKGFLLHSDASLVSLLG